MLQIFVELAQVVVLYANVLCLQVAILHLAINRLRRHHAFMMDLLLQGMDRTLARNDLLLQVFDLVLSQIAAVLQVIVLLLEALILEDGDLELLFHFFEPLPKFQRLFQSQRLLAQRQAVCNCIGRETACAAVTPRELRRQGACVKITHVVITISCEVCHALISRLTDHVDRFLIAGVELQIQRHRRLLHRVVVLIHLEGRLRLDRRIVVTCFTWRTPVVAVVSVVLIQWQALAVIRSV